ncbi:hypothetical protein [Streptomyces fragilis]|uniref:Uncharacterized protein n=1 Tax=Streptomyces fragilis TaxID=67301 RepID=A0ABV2YRN7_9ACTN|nr:hypothetical protein [Streptomyces fragilis]
MVTAVTGGGGCPCQDGGGGVLGRRNDYRPDCYDLIAALGRLAEKGHEEG